MTILPKKKTPGPKSDSENVQDHGQSNHYQDRTILGEYANRPPSPPGSLRSFIKNLSTLFAWSPLLENRSSIITSPLIGGLSERVRMRGTRCVWTWIIPLWCKSHTGSYRLLGPVWLLHHRGMIHVHTQRVPLILTRSDNPPIRGLVIMLLLFSSRGDHAKSVERFLVNDRRDPGGERGRLAYSPRMVLSWYY